MLTKQHKQEKTDSIITGQSGFTLLELIVSITVMGIVAGVVIGVVALHARTVNIVSSRTLARYDVRQTLRILRDDVQQISPENLIYNGGDLTADQLEFTDLNANHIIYTRSNGGVFARNGTTLLNNVQQDPFTYRDINLNATNLREDVRYIDVSFDVLYGSQNVTIEDRFYVRN